MLAAPTQGPVPHRRVVDDIQVCTYFCSFGNSMNSVWSGMCFRTRQTLCSERRQTVGHAKGLCAGQRGRLSFHLLKGKAFVPLASRTPGHHLSDFCHETWEDLPFESPCLLSLLPKEPHQQLCGNHTRRVNSGLQQAPAWAPVLGSASEAPPGLSQDEDHF